MASTMIFCSREGALFPDDEFLYDKQGNLYSPNIHKQPSPHYANTGSSVQPLGAGSIPGVLDVTLGEIYQSRYPVDYINLKTSNTIPGTFDNFSIRDLLQVQSGPEIARITEILEHTDSLLKSGRT